MKRNIFFKHPLNHFTLPSTVVPAQLLLLLILGVCWTACNHKSANQADRGEEPGAEAVEIPGLETVEKTDAYGNIERYSRRLEDYAREGPYALISPDGNTLESANYHNDTLHGLRVLYFASGDTQIVERYEHGIFSGPYYAFYEGGRLELEGTYIANSMEGIWKRYYEDGQLMEEVSFRDNQENGPFTEFHENGKIKAEGFYKDGDNEHGLLKIYDREGNLEKTMNCQHGVCRTVWERGKNDS